jgi:hypothetical protein
MKNEKQRNESRWERFRTLLRADRDDSTVDYDTAESVLFRRIEEAEHSGPDSSLKCDQVVDDAFWGRVERGIFERIQSYHEYEEPVDECIRNEETVPERYWRRIDSGVQRSVDTVSSLQLWEQMLKADEILTEGRWEATEERLMEKIERSDRIASRIAWPVMSVMAAPLRRAVLYTALALILSSAIVGYYLFYPSGTDLPTYVYQIQGGDIGSVDFVSSAPSEYSSASGRSVTLVNDHGFIRLNNDVRLTLARCTDSDANYRLRFDRAVPGTPSRSAATFFVRKRASRHRYTVALAAYEIEVTGTYFTVAADSAGKAVTTVLEGMVEIRSGQFGDISLHEGQSIRIGPDLSGYSIERTGRKLDRRSIEKIPEAAVLQRYYAVRVVANVAGAVVCIDGELCGKTPMRILRPEGVDTLRILKEGYTVFDTVLRVTPESAPRIHASLERIPAIDDTDGRKMPVVALKDSSESTVPAVPASSQPGSSLDLFRQAREAERTDWEKAIALYRRIAADDSIADSKRQIALFSIGRLLADYKHDAAAARDTFMLYFSRYPEGAFASEALLRCAEIEFNRDQSTALKQYLKYLHSFPNHYRNAEIRYRVGLIYMQRNSYKDAIAMLESSLAALRTDPQNLRRRIYAALHRAYTATGAMEEARTIHESFLTDSQ